jgi:hypothetical protein
MLSVVAFSLVGCAGDSDMQAYLKAQLDALDRQKPLVMLEAQPGQTMELKGVKSLVVYAPNGNASQIRPLESQWAPVWREALRVAGVVGGIYYGGQALTNLAEAMGKNAGAHISGSFNTSGNQSPVGYNTGGRVSISAASSTTTTNTDNHGGEKTMP